MAEEKTDWFDVFLGLSEREINESNVKNAKEAIEGMLKDSCFDLAFYLAYKYKPELSGDVIDNLVRHAKNFYLGATFILKFPSVSEEIALKTLKGLRREIESHQKIEKKLFAFLENKF